MRRKITIVGGGACALMLGCELDTNKFEVSIYEKNAAPGRKFLVAGDGGLNLSHSEHETDFINRYTPEQFLQTAFHHFSNKDLVNWLHAKGIQTHTGSSGRLFPEKGIKPIAVLNKLLDHIKNNGVLWQFKQEWTGFSEHGNLLFKHGAETQEVSSDIVIFCLGGASWPVTGSAGDWKIFFAGKNIRVDEFMASNCAFKIDWDKSLLPKIEGKVLKNISIRCGEHTHAGEVVLTQFGMEGSGIYPLSPQIREQLLTSQKAQLTIDLKPSVSLESLIKKITAKPVKTNFTAHIKEHLNLSDVQLTLLKHLVSREDFLDPVKLCTQIKNLNMNVTGLGPIADAISTVGGISLYEIDQHFQLKKLPGYFAVGEMLDYDAPTGGYLLQSCFSMGKFLADHLNNLY